MQTKNKNMKQTNTSVDFPYGKPEHLEDICIKCGGRRGLHNHMNQRCPKDINASADHMEYQDTVFSLKKPTPLTLTLEAEKIYPDKSGIFLEMPNQSIVFLQRQAYIAAVTAEREKAKELAQAFKSLMDEIDARGYKNDFKEQRAILDKYSKSIVL